MNKEQLVNEIKKLNIDINEETVKKLEEYLDYLLEYNKHTNLTAIKDKEEAYLKHIYDSLTISKIIKLENQNLLDVGTGAGLPGLVLKIVFPKLKVTLLDSNNKKTTFLKDCIHRLELKDIEVIHGRMEEFAQEKEEQYDIVTTRAVAELRILIELNMKVLKIDGHFIAMKANVEEEVIKANNALEKLDAKIIEKQEFDLPKNKGHRTLLKIKKINHTNKIYPRTYDKIKKKPL